METVKNNHLGKSFTEADMYKASTSKNQAQATNSQQAITSLDYITKT